MNCTQCGTPHTEEASFCANCGSPLTSVQAPASPQSGAAPPQRTIAHGDLAIFGQRIGSALIDFVLGSIPFVDVPVLIANGIMHRRGDSIGLKIAGARIVRRNGDVSGFFHTAVRVWAAILSAIPLGLGFWWAFWDPWRQTWHDKIMGTYVLRDTEELSRRPGSSSGVAVAWFWILLVAPFLLGVFIFAIPNFGGFREAGAQLSYEGDQATLQTAVDAFRSDYPGNVGGLYPTVGALSAASTDDCANRAGTKGDSDTLGPRCKAYVDIAALVSGATIGRLDVAGGFLASTSAILSASAKNGGTIRLGRYDWYVASNGQVRSDPTWEAAKAYL